MVYIYYQSDFKLCESMPHGIVPFLFIYKTGNGMEYSASYDGVKWVNCKKISNNKVAVAFKNHSLQPGRITVSKRYYTNIPEYVEVNNLSTDIFLADKEADSSIVSTSVIDIPIK